MGTNIYNTQEVKYSHKKWKDSLETQAVLLIFSLELKIEVYFRVFDTQTDRVLSHLTRATFKMIL